MAGRVEVVRHDDLVAREGSGLAEEDLHAEPPCVVEALALAIAVIAVGRRGVVSPLDREHFIDGGWREEPPSLVFAAVHHHEQDLGEVGRGDAQVALRPEDRSICARHVFFVGAHLGPAR